MHPWDTVAIVGVGLIGGSIGLSLRSRNLARNVIGIGHRPASLHRAREMGAITRSTVKLDRGVRDADLVIVCTPVDRVAELLIRSAHLTRPGTLLTDAGSTKQTIVERVESQLPDGSTFIGSHPLAGGERAGVAHACDDLLSERTVVITPTRRTTAATTRRAGELWESLGASVLKMSPRKHDAAVAGTSHVPHLVAAALAAATPTRLAPLTSTGWRDTTRIAAGDPQLWEQILLDNAEAVLKSLDQFERGLAEFRRALERDDAGELRRLLRKGKSHRDTLGS